MIRKDRFFLGALLVCLVCLFFMTGGVFSKSAAKDTGDEKAKAVQSKTPKKKVKQTPKILIKTKQAPAAGSKDVQERAPQTRVLPLSIRRIFMDEDTIHVTIEKTKGKKVTAADYATIRLEVKTDGQKAPSRWSLLQLDPGRRLNLRKGSIIFDTKLGLKKRGKVQVTLSKGLWKTSKDTTLAPGMASTGKTMKMVRVRPANTRIMKNGQLKGAMKAPVAGKEAGVTASIRDRIPGGGPGSFQGLNDSGGIRVFIPYEGHVSHPGDVERIFYTFNYSAEAGRSTLELRRLSSSDPLATYERPYNPDADDPTLRVFWEFPEYGLPAGDDYYICVTHPDGGWGVGNRFSIQPHGGATIDEEPSGPACDYAINMIRFAEGGRLDQGLELGTGATVSGTFLVFVRWNGIEVPSEYPPGTEFNYRITVYSKNTGERLCAAGGVTFAYAPEDVITVHLPFSFDKDRIPAMCLGRFMPLEFRLEPLGSSIDATPRNNTHEESMRILNGRENDMEISLTYEDMTLHRTPQAGPMDEYLLVQECQVRNLSRNEAGGPPSPIDVTIRWCLDFRDGDEPYDDYCGYGSGTFTIERVGENWVPVWYSHIFRALDPDDIPEGREFRMLMEVDPDHELIDSNRTNNLGWVRFTIVD